jgi:hypothetical protein
MSEHSAFKTFLGDTGPKGEPGGNMVIYTYGHATGAHTDPRDGNFSFFQTGLEEVSGVYLHKHGFNSLNNRDWISGLDDSDSSVKGSLRVSHSGNAQQFALFDITGSVQALTGVQNQTGEYYSIPSQFVYSSSPANGHLTTGVFVDGDSVVISFSRAGDIGNQGPQGVEGPQGPQGPSDGPTGPQGSQGITGPSGATGVIGAQGAQGIVGPLGPQGITGPSGATGIVGEEGPQGPQGAVGPTGITGPSGATGIVGEEGPQGALGPQGPQGPAGGPQGEPGIISGGGFKAYLTSDSSTTQNVEQIVPLGSEAFDTNDEYSHSSYAFSPNVSGTYLLHAQISYLNNDGYSSEGEFSQIKRYRDASETVLTRSEVGIGIAWSTYGQPQVLPMTTVADLHSGDQVKITFNPGANYNVDIVGGLHKTYFAGHILGGPPGERGITGPTGASGLSGLIGPTGVQGPQGPQGPSGPSGLAFVGSTGPTGAQGAQGAIGPTGLTGPSGSAFVGSTGPTGAQGIQGLDGYVTGEGFFAYRSGESDYAISGQTETVIKQLSVVGYVDGAHKGGFDNQNVWSTTNLESGYWEPNTKGKYLIKSTAKINNALNSGTPANFKIRMAHSGLDPLTSSQILSETITHPSSSPSLSTSVISHVPATGELYFATIYINETGEHELEGSYFNTSFSAHGLGGVRGSQGSAGERGNIGLAGPQGLSGPQGAGGLAYQSATSDIQMQPNIGYIVNNSTEDDRLVLTLPTGNTSNGRSEVIGKTLGGWRVAQNTGQKVIFGYMETIQGTGGYIESSHQNDFVKLVCLSTGVYPTEFAVAGSVGSIIVY